MSRVDSYLFTLWVGLPLSLFIFLTYANSGFPGFFFNLGLADLQGAYIPASLVPLRAEAFDDSICGIL